MTPRTTLLLLALGVLLLVLPQPVPNAAEACTTWTDPQGANHTQCPTIERGAA